MYIFYHIVILVDLTYDCIFCSFDNRASLLAQLVKSLPAMQETWVRFLGEEYPQEKEMAIHSSILVWKIPWTEELGGLQSTGLQELDTA